MNRRPRSITLIGWAFIAVGAVTLVAGLIPPIEAAVTQRIAEVTPARVAEFGWMLVVRSLAVVCGAFLLSGSNWARWLLIVWLAYHVVLGAMHSLFGFAVHLLLLVTIAYFLVKPAATEHFRHRHT
jgi:hypothetical protein